MDSTLSLTFNADQEYNHSKEVKEFDDSKIGVKGLVDSGLTSIPRMFIHPSNMLPDCKHDRPSKSDLVPIIDLSGFDSDCRLDIVEQISRASKDLGFFQIVNHGVPLEVMDKVINGIKAFHEMPTEVKKRWYQRKQVPGINFYSNFDLLTSKAASWRDTFEIKMVEPNWREIEEEIPEICKQEVIEWNQQAMKVAELLMELLCEGLRVDSGTLKQRTLLEGRVINGNYYPPCPQPDLTFGIISHTDPGGLTLLLQDSIGGLQVKHGNEWIDVKPIPGAIVVNIGDILQIMSNDEYKSGEHRVLANHLHEPRISVVTFFSPGNKECLCGPFPDLISSEKPAIYRQFTFIDFINTFFSIGLDHTAMKNHYKL